MEKGLMVKHATCTLLYNQALVIALHFSITDCYQRKIAQHEKNNKKKPLSGEQNLFISLSTENVFEKEAFHSWNVPSLDDKNTDHFRANVIGGDFKMLGLVTQC